MEEKILKIDDNKYLGKLCKREHNWKKTNKSLRYKKGHHCIECAKICQRIFSQSPKCKK